MNLVKWGEGGFSYEALKSTPMDEILRLQDEALKINEEVRRRMAKGETNGF